MRIIYILIIIVCFFTSCSESFLDEEPIDFISAENAFRTYDDFQLSINGLYEKVRTEFFTRNGDHPFTYLYGTDLVYDGQPFTTRFSPYTSTMQPSGGYRIPEKHWVDLYKIVSESNLILSRLEQVEFADEQETKLEAQARFFRAFAYRTLTYLYGGVPLILEEVKEAKLDYVRASKREVLEQCILDATFAGENLPSISSVRDGEISDLVAYHLLSELYIVNDQPEQAISAATIVINDPNTALMTERFGSRANETPGDPFWDLYRMNNQNRASGNKESLWVIQFETDVPGGATVSNDKAGGFYLERHHAPFVRNIRVGGSDVPPFLWPRTNLTTGGRGVGWAISTKYFTNTIWEDDFDGDQRNANHNFVRDFTIDNPDHPLFGTTISTENPPEGITVPSRDFYAYQSKITTPGNHPENLFDDFALGILTSRAGASYADQYLFRLAETYLLRAEAYMNSGRLDLAARDINTVRERSQASPVTPGEVDIDYILDERMREMGVEEKRRLTLMRLGLLYDRVTACNPYYENIQEFHNLFPIPFNEIERNTEATIEQNPGYENL